MQVIKSGIAYSFASYSNTFINKSQMNITIKPNKYDNKYTYDKLKEIYDNLTQEQRNKVETIYWELSKKEDSRIDGLFYGRDHFFDNLKLTTRSLHRCGLLLSEEDDDDDDDDGDNSDLIKIEYSSRFKRNKSMIVTQYYSLGEKFGKDYETGWCGYVNGMGNTIGWAGYDASKLSDSLIEGNDLHCVYLPTYQISPDNYSPPNDLTGLCFDVIRHLTVNGGEYSKTSILITQLWIDYLIDNPTKCFLQICASDGGTFVSNAIKIMVKYCPPELVSRISIILLAPGCVLLPEEYNNIIPVNQVVNLIKKEDHLISKFATGANYLGKHQNVIIVPHNHKNDHPHNFTNQDYITCAIPFIQNWKRNKVLF